MKTSRASLFRYLQDDVYGKPEERLRLDRFRFDDREREIAQRWWAENEAAIREMRYADVKPGEPFIASSQFLPGVTSALAEKLGFTSPIAPAGHSSPATAGSTPPLQSPVTVATDSGFQWLIWGAASTVAFGGLLWILRRRILRRNGRNRDSQ